MRRNKFIILFFASAGCFSDVPVSSTTSGDADTDTDSGSTGGDATSVTTASTSSATQTSETTSDSDSMGGSTGGSSGGVSETSGETTGAGTTTGPGTATDVGSTSEASSTGGSSGGAAPEWSECIDNTDVQTAVHCNSQCENMGMECADACGPNGDLGIIANWDDPTCNMPPNTPHTLCVHNPGAYIQCCCV